MNLSDNGRVTPVKRIFGSNADIGIKGETQIEKWAYFRENVHRNFRPTHWKNVAGGIIFGIVIPYGLYKFIMWGMVLIYFKTAFGFFFIFFYFHFLGIIGRRNT